LAQAEAATLQETQAQLVTLLQVLAEVKAEKLVGLAARVVRVVAALVDRMAARVSLVMAALQCSQLRVFLEATDQLVTLLGAAALVGSALSRLAVLAVLRLFLDRPLHTLLVEPRFPLLLVQQIRGQAVEVEAVHLMVLLVVAGLLLFVPSRLALWLDSLLQAERLLRLRVTALSV
jgi:hypothetical protein